MIKIDISMPSDGQPIKVIYFSDRQGYPFRTAYFLNEKLVLDEIIEFTEDKHTQSKTLFNESYEVIAYQEYLKNSDGIPHGTVDYKMINGKLQKLNSMLFEIISKESHHMKEKWFNGAREYIYSVERSDDIPLRYIKPNGQVVNYDTLHEFLSTNKPLDFFEIRNQYLKQIIDENN